MIFSRFVVSTLCGVVIPALLSTGTLAKGYHVSASRSGKSTTLSPQLIIDNSIVRTALATSRRGMMQEVSFSLEDRINLLQRRLPPPSTDSGAWEPANVLLADLKRTAGADETIDVMVVAGAKEGGHVRGCVHIDYRLGTKQWRRLQRSWRRTRQEKFIEFVLENIQQHVADGIAVVVRQKHMDYEKIAVLDNGPGFVDKRGRHVSIAHAVAFARSYGRGGKFGMGLTAAVTLNADIAVIIQDEQIVVVTERFLPMVRRFLTSRVIPRIVSLGFAATFSLVGYCFLSSGWARVWDSVLLATIGLGAAYIGWRIVPEEYPQAVGEVFPTEPGRGVRIEGYFHTGQGDKRQWRDEMVASLRARYREKKYSLSAEAAGIPGPRAFAARYVDRAQKIFGPAVMRGRDMDTEWQERVEISRRSIFEPFAATSGPHSFSFASDIYVQLTDQCTAACPYCFVSCGPWKRTRMSAALLERVLSPVPGRSGLDEMLGRVFWGGGEPLLADVGSAIGRSPLRGSVIITNASQITDDKKARNFVETVREAHQNRPVYRLGQRLFSSEFDDPEDNEAHIGISVDDAHLSQVDNAVLVIDAVLRYYPTAAVFLKVVDEFNTRDWPVKIVETLHTIGHIAGLDPAQEAITIKNSKGVTIKKIAIERMSLWRVGRAVFCEASRFPVGRDWTRDIGVMTRFPEREVNVLADGRVVIESTFMAEPVPHWIGNLQEERWPQILRRAHADPIYMALKKWGIRDILTFFAEYDPVLESRVRHQVDDEHAYLYWAMINPERKMYLTLRLLQRYVHNGRFSLRGSARPEFLDMAPGELVPHIRELMRPLEKNKTLASRERIIHLAI